jgi:hypothetical protein
MANGKALHLFENLPRFYKEYLLLYIAPTSWHMVFSTQKIEDAGHHQVIKPQTSCCTTLDKSM